MSRTPIARLGWVLLLSCAPAFADEEDEKEADGSGHSVESAQGDIQRDTQRLGKSGGVRPEVLEGRGGYGSAGCGLGSVILKPSEHFTQIFAATTNGLFGNQTFGITSGTSNCDGPPNPVHAARRYVVANRAALAVATARGRGESIEALAALAGCSRSDQLGPVLQRNFGRIFPDAAASDLQVSRAMLEVMREHSSELRCSTLNG